jgi:ribonuclease E
MPAGVEPPTVAEVAPLVEETMPTVTPIAPIATVGELELAPVAPIDTEEQAPAEQVELAPVAPVEIAPVTPLAPVEAPVEQPAALELHAPIEAVAPIEEPVSFETVAPIEAAAPVEHFEPAPFAIEPVTETATDQVAEIVDEPATETAPEVETTPTTRFRVVIRLSGAEPVEAGGFDAVGEAKDRAFEIVGQLTSEDGSWPYFRGRYLRPDAIVSVDIVEETAW